MIKILGAAMIAFSLTMLTFCQYNGYAPVSRPICRVYRNSRPAYFWTLIAGYALVGAIGIRVLAG